MSATHTGAAASKQSPGSAAQRSVAAQGADAVRARRAPPIVHEVLRSPGRPLDGATQARFQARFAYDFGQVRVHNDERAHESARSVNARAYTVGRDVVFARNRYAPGTEDGRRLLAHELTHVVQQRSPYVSGAALRVSRPGELMEQEAHRTSLAESADASQLTRLDALVLARDGPDGGAPPGDGGAPAQKHVSAVTQPIIDLLEKVDPVAGVGDVDAAMRALAALSPDDVITAVAELATGPAYLERLRGATASAPANDRARIAAAIDIGRLFSPSATPTTLAEAATALAAIPPAEREELLAALSKRAGSTIPIPELLEGAEAIRESEAASDLAGPVGGDEGEDDPTIYPDDVPESGAAAAAAIKPGPWNPPGRQPIPFYIGTQAHIGITAVYAAAHPGHVAFYNFSTMKVIIDAAIRMGLKPNAALLKAKDLGLMPDIANLSAMPRHLYEIKPATAEALAVAKATMYAALFAAAGLPMTLGPVTERGTMGTIPAPGGVYTFSSPKPGAITYRYRQPRRVRRRAKQEDRSRIRWPKPNPQLSPAQNAVMLALGAIMLMFMAAASLVFG